MEATTFTRIKYFNVFWCLYIHGRYLRKVFMCIIFAYTMDIYFVELVWQLKIPSCCLWIVLVHCLILPFGYQTASQEACSIARAVFQTEQEGSPFFHSRILHLCHGHGSSSRCFIPCPPLPEVSGQGHAVAVRWRMCFLPHYGVPLWLFNWLRWHTSSCAGTEHMGALDSMGCGC